MKIKIFYLILFVASNKYVFSTIIFALAALALINDFTITSVILFTTGLIPLALHYIASKLNVQ